MWRLILVTWLIHLFGIRHWTLLLIIFGDDPWLTNSWAPFSPVITCSFSFWCLPPTPATALTFPRISWFPHRFYGLFLPSPGRRTSVFYKQIWLIQEAKYPSFLTLKQKWHVSYYNLFSFAWQIYFCTPNINYFYVSYVSHNFYVLLWTFNLCRLWCFTFQSSGAQIATLTSWSHLYAGLSLLHIGILPLASLEVSLLLGLFQTHSGFLVPKHRITYPPGSPPSP